MRVSRFMFWALTCSLGFAILATLVLSMSMSTRGMDRFFAIMWVFNGHLATAAIAISAYERNRVRPLAILGVIASPVAFLLWMWIFVQGEEVEALRRWGTAMATPFTAMAVYAAFVGALMHLPRADGGVLLLRRIVFVIAAVAAVHIVAAVVAYPFRTLSYALDIAYVDRHWRWAGVYLIVITYTTLAATAMVYLRRLRAGDRPVVEPMPVRVTCPRCDLAQQMKTEGDACSGCGLRIKVAVL